MKVIEDHIFSLKDHILHAAFEEGGVLFNLEDRVSIVINQTGTKLLNLLDGKRDVKEIARVLSGIYEKSEDVIKEDMILFLLDLVERGWVYDRRKRGDKG